jgi:hypothetical protein
MSLSRSPIAASRRRLPDFRANLPPILRRLRAPGFDRGERPLEKKSSAPSCVSWLWTFHFLSREPATPGESKTAPSAAALERASAIGRYRRARVSTINGLEVSPGHLGRHPDEWLFDTGRQIIPPPAVTGRRFAGPGPRSTVRPARQVCRSGAEKFRPAEPEQSSRSWRTWLRRSHGPSFATRP